MLFKPDFLIIPYIAIENPNLQPLDRILYGVVYYFEKMKEGKCIASNETLREFAQSKNINSIQHSLERLEKEGYIKRFYRDKNRKIRKEIKCKVVFKVLSNDNRVCSNKHTVLSNKHSKVLSNDNQISKSNISNNNKEKQITAKQSFAIPLNEVLDKFQEVNPSYKKLFGNTTQRGAMQRLVDQHGAEKIIQFLEVLPETNKMKYAPVITTPVALENKLGDLIVFVQKEKINNRVVKL